MVAATLLLSTSLATAHSPGGHSGGILHSGGITRGFGHSSFGQIRPGFGQIRPGFGSYGGYHTTYRPNGFGAAYGYVGGGQGYNGGGNIGAGIVGAILGIAAGAIGSRLAAPVIVAPPVIANPPAMDGPAPQAVLPPPGGPDPDRETWRKQILNDAARFCDAFADDVACTAKQQP